jgi:hypothetical protein
LGGHSLIKVPKACLGAWSCSLRRAWGRSLRLRVDRPLAACLGIGWEWGLRRPLQRQGISFPFSPHPPPRLLAANVEAYGKHRGSSSGAAWLDAVKATRRQRRLDHLRHRCRAWGSGSLASIAGRPLQTLGGGQAQQHGEEGPEVSPRGGERTLSSFG